MIYSTAIKLSKTFVATLALICALLVAVNSIPNQAIVDNLRRSLPASNYERSPTGVAIDYFTECVAATIGIASGNNSNIIRNTFLSPAAKSCVDARKYIENGTGEVWNYWRFWHGYQVISRPLLAVISLQAIFNIVFASFCISAYIFYESIRVHLGVAYARSAAAALLCVPIYSGAYLFSHALLWILGFLAASWFLRARAGNDQVSLDVDLRAFLVIGMLTSFIGFLTTPLVTLTIPLLVLYWVGSSGRIGAGSSWSTIVLYCAIWVVGYAGCWVVKWAIMFAFFNEDVLREGLGQVSVRLSAKSFSPRAWVEMDASAVNSYKENLWEVRYGLFGFAIFLVISLVRAKWRQQARIVTWPFGSADQAVKFAIIFALPLLWLGFVRNHSIMHAYFVAPILYTCFALSIWFVNEAVGARSERCEQSA